MMRACEPPPRSGGVAARRRRCRGASRRASISCVESLNPCPRQRAQHGFGPRRRPHTRFRVRRIRRARSRCVRRVSHPPGVHGYRTASFEGGPAVSAEPDQHHRELRRPVVRALVQSPARRADLRHRAACSRCRGCVRACVAQGAWEVESQVRAMEVNIPGIAGAGETVTYFIDRFGHPSIYDIDFVTIPHEAPAGASLTRIRFDHVQRSRRSRARLRRFLRCGAGSRASGR